MTNNEDHRFDPQLEECRRVSVLEARRRGLSMDAADDVAQDTCLDLWTALIAEKPIRSVGAWARTAAGRRIVDDHRRTSASKRGGGLLESLEAHLENPTLRQTY